jgi:hypothetical protein
MKVLAFVLLALVGTTQAGLACDVCEGLISFVDKLLQNNEQNIENEASKYCNDLGPLSSTCQSLIKNYLPQIIADLKDGDDQKTICNAIGGFCDEDKKLPMFNMKCTICEELLKIIAAFGKNEETVIENAVDKICDSLGFFKQSCVDLVKDYVPKLINALDNGQTEEKACSYVGMCSAQKAVAKAVVEKQTRGLECSLCEALISFVANLLGDDEAQIKQKADQYCQDLPVLGSVCQQLVNKYLDQIIEYLKQGQDQKQICNELDNFCGAAQSRIAVQKAFLAHVKGQSKGVTCEICEDVCKWIIEYGVDKGLDAIEDYVNGKCDDLPFIGDECKKLVDKWLGKLVALLQKDLPPQKVCQEVDLC